MKLGNPHDEIKFLDSVGTTARYVVILDGEPTMIIHCNTEDKDRVITILDPNSKHVLATKGRFTMKTKLMEDSEGAPLGVAEPYVDRKSVYGYVLPRLHVLLGRLVRAAATA